MLPSSSALVEALRAIGLLSRERLEAVAQRAATIPEARALAEELVRDGWITEHQAGELLEGRGNGLVVGPYLLLEHLGKGGMGQVFRARHRVMNRLVALKVILPDRLDSPRAVERFLREAQAAACLSHPNIVVVHDAGQSGDTFFLAMELVEGTNLAEHLQDHGPLGVAEACHSIRQAALGLQHAHEQGLVHRDVKPANLMRTRTEQIKVLDLGLALVSSATALTQDSRAMLGTPGYIAPEQVSGAHGVDIRADVYSLGCTLYHLLAGREPYAGSDPRVRAVVCLVQDPPPLAQFRKDVPAALLAVLQRMMARQREDRYATPGEVAEALEAFLTPVGAASKPPIPPVPAVRGPAPRRHSEPSRAGLREAAAPATVNAGRTELAPPTRAEPRPQEPRSASGLFRHRRRFVVALVALGLVGVLAAGVTAVGLAVKKRMVASIEGVTRESGPVHLGRLVLTLTQAEVEAGKSVVVEVKPEMPAGTFPGRLVEIWVDGKRWIAIQRADTNQFDLEPPTQETRAGVRQVVARLRKNDEISADDSAPQPLRVKPKPVPLGRFVLAPDKVTARAGERFELTLKWEKPRPAGLPVDELRFKAGDQELVSQMRPGPEDRVALVGPKKPGKYTIAAVFAGKDHYLPGKALNEASLEVGKWLPKFKVLPPLDPEEVSWGTVAVGVELESEDRDVPVPTGTVELISLAPRKALTTRKLDKGKATLTLTERLQPGTYSLRLEYSGDDWHAAGTFELGSHRVGTRGVVNSIGMRLARIPAGTFTMGSTHSRGHVHNGITEDRGRSRGG
jgi:serine/threonine-protein kinase